MRPTFVAASEMLEGLPVSSVTGWENFVLASVRSATLLGIAGQPVQVEVHVSNGLPVFI